MNQPPDNDPQGAPPSKNSRIGRREIGAILLSDVSERTVRAETLEGPEAHAAAGVQPARGAPPAAGAATVAAS